MRGAGPGGGPGVLDIYERAVLDQALVQTYAAAGITSDPATHERPAPLLAHLHAVLNQMDGDVCRAAGDAAATPHSGRRLARRWRLRGSHERDAGPAVCRLPHPRACRKSCGRWRFT